MDRDEWRACMGDALCGDLVKEATTFRGHDSEAHSDACCSSAGIELVETGL